MDGGKRGVKRVWNLVECGQREGRLPREAGGSPQAEICHEVESASLSVRCPREDGRDGIRVAESVIKPPTAGSDEVGAARRLCWSRDCSSILRLRSMRNGYELLSWRDR